MAEKTVIISYPNRKPIKILYWKVRVGSSISVGSQLFVYEIEKAELKQPRTFKSSRAGIVCQIVAQEGTIIKPSEALLKLEACIHPTVMKDMCAECGADLRKEDMNGTASIPMIHSVPELKVSEALAQKLGKADSERLLKDKKLVLLVDLDQTLIHTTNDIIPPNIKDVYHFQLYGPNSPWYHTRLRPGTHNFLTNICPYFELHICTFGARNYAHRITAILDEDGRLFSNRVLSRDECFNSISKTANLKALFPCGDHMVCIIDDREDVWCYASNLIHVKPYHFFKHTGDINAPPGLGKLENDEKDCVDLSKIKHEDKWKKDEEKNETVEDIGNIPTVEEDKTEKNHIDNIDIDNTDVSTEISSTTTNKETLTNGENNTQVETSASNNENNIGINGDISFNDKIDISDKKNELQQSTIDSSNEIEVEDPDDYLLYLEDILKRIHTAFYEHYDKMESGAVPDLKAIVPDVKGQVLQGCRMVFSGLVPTHVKLIDSRAYQVARSLGAEVTPDFVEGTTHLVAVRPGTVKVNAGRRRKNLKIVTPDWLWACAERWEHVDEQIYPLHNKGSKNRHPPPHCSSPEHVPNYEVHEMPAARKRSPSGRFMDTINPLMSFSPADIADMDKEVEDILDAESESEDDKSVKAIECTISSSSSCESLSSDTPRGHKRSFEDRIIEEYEDDGNTKDSDELPSAKFRRGEDLDSDLDIGQESNSEGSLEPADEIDDGEWNMMGAALEREFLSNT